MIKDYHKVTEVIPGRGMVTLKTNKGDFRARKVVMTQDLNEIKIMPH